MRLIKWLSRQVLDPEFDAQMQRLDEERDRSRLGMTPEQAREHDLGAIRAAVEEREVEDLKLAGRLH